MNSFVSTMHRDFDASFSPITVFRLIPNEGGWRGWRVGLGVGVEVFT